MSTDFIAQSLDDLKRKNLLRVERLVESAQGAVVEMGGKTAACFCSNNYLSLAGRRELAEAAAEAARKWGCGSTASRLVSGTMTLHRELEDAIARIKGRAAALLFPTGYMANVGAIAAMASAGDAVIIDRLNHASIIDGCRLSGARLLVYRHRDVEHLDVVLARAAGFRRRLVITDSIFSMDGDIAPLPDIIECCRRHDAILMVDEAHSTGVLGASGRGAEEHFGLNDCDAGADVVMGTLSKAVGSLGGFIAGSRELVDYLRNTSRSYIYTTALPPPACAASLAGLKIIADDSRPHAKLWKNVHLAHDLLATNRLIEPVAPDARTPIIPVCLKDTETAVKVSQRLVEAGYLCPAIRPPTVAAGTSRLRVSLQADHTQPQICGLVEAIVRAKSELVK